MKSYLVKVNKNTEGEIIEKLEGVPSKQGYIKDLIRKPELPPVGLAKEVHDQQQMLKSMM